MRVFATRAAWLCALMLASAAPVASDGHWTVGEWSECSRACDGGTRYREVTCADADGCGASPPVDAEACNWHACPTYAWSAGSWGECDATCGFAGERRRLVQCRAVAPSDDFATLGDVLEMRNALGDATWIGATSPRLKRLYDARVDAGRVVPDATCLAFNASMSRPASLEPCAQTPCTYRHWDVGPWSECDATCGGGTKTRRVFCVQRDDLWEEMTESFYSRHDVPPDPSQAPPPPRPETRSVVADAVCESYASFIGAAPDSTAPCNARACPWSPRWDVSSFQDEALGCASRSDALDDSSEDASVRVLQRAVRCVVGGVEGDDATALRETALSECEALAASGDLAPKPPADVPCGASAEADASAGAFCDGADDVCSFAGTCDSVVGACVCDAGRAGPRCEIDASCGALDGEPVASDDAGECCPGVVDAAGTCCHTQLGVARLDGDGVCCASGAVDACGVCGGASKAVDITGKCCVGSLDAGGFCCASGVFDACGACDGTGETCPVWVEMSVVVPEDVRDAGDAAVAAHVWEWAELALDLSGAVPTDAAAYLDESAKLSGTSSFATSAMAPPPPRARPPPPPTPPGVQAPSPSPPPGTDATDAPDAGEGDVGAKRRRLAQTGTASYPVAAAFPVRVRRAASATATTGERGIVSETSPLDFTAFALERLERLDARSNRAFERADAPGATDALWNTRARRVLGLARAGVCGDGFCEALESCGYGAVERTVVPGGVVADIDATAARVDAYEQRAIERGITGWQESLRVVVEAHNERGTGVLGPALARAAAACCPEDCPAPAACPAPEGSDEPCGGHGLCLPATGQCVCFPNGGYTGVACGECAAGFTRSRGFCVKRRRRAAPAPPTPPPANTTAAAGGDAPDAADPSAAALHALAGVVAAVASVCLFGTICGGCGRLASRVLRAKKREEEDDELGLDGLDGLDEELGKASFPFPSDRAFGAAGETRLSSSPKRPSAPVFEFRRAPAVQGGFIEEALGTAQGRWRSYVVDPSGARRAVRDEDIRGASPGSEKEEEEKEEAAGFETPRASGFFFGDGERASDGPRLDRRLRGSDRFSDASGRERARRRPAAPDPADRPPFPSAGRAASFQDARFPPETRSADASEEEEEAKANDPRVASSAAATAKLRAERVVERLEKKLARPTAAPVAAPADRPPAEDAARPDSKRDADVADGLETPARGLAAAECRRIEFGCGDVGDPVNAAPNAHARFDSRDTRGLPASRRGERSAKRRGFDSGAPRDGAGRSGVDATRHLGRWPPGSVSSGERSAVGGCAADDDARGDSDEYASSRAGRRVLTRGSDDVRAVARCERPRVDELQRGDA